MTKQNMTALLQERAAELWVELARYDNENAPDDGNHRTEWEWETTDIGHIKRLYAWCAVQDLLEAMGIPAVYGDEAYNLRHELWLRRNANRNRVG